MALPDHKTVHRQQLCSWAAALLALLSPPVGEASDWPQFLGPTRNLVSKEPVSSQWPKEGPTRLWSRPAGPGWSGPVIVRGRVILFHRVADEEVVESLEAATGKTIWKFSYPSQYVDDFGFDSGPRATPTVEGNRVITFGAEGKLHVIDFSTGEKIWGVATRQQFQAGKGYFGMACSPLVEGDAILLNIGGKNGAGIVAFNKASGEVLWKSTHEEASYSSPVMAEFGGKRRALFFTPSGLIGLDPLSGAEKFRYSLKPGMRASVSAATPIVSGPLVFLSASYGAGAAVIEIENDQVKKRWAGDDILSNHYATSVEADGYLYGFEGRQEQGCALRCVELQTGKIKWSEDNFGAGTLLLAGKQLLILREGGELVLAKASPDQFQIVEQAQILPANVRAYPALADSLFVARSEKQLACFRLTAAESPPPPSTHENNH